MWDRKQEYKRRIGLTDPSALVTLGEIAVNPV
jgi:hypothetical protein